MQIVCYSSFYLGLRNILVSLLSTIICPSISLNIYEWWISLHGKCQMYSNEECYRYKPGFTVLVGQTLSGTKMSVNSFYWYFFVAIPSTTAVITFHRYLNCSTSSSVLFPIVIVIPSPSFLAILIILVFFSFIFIPYFSPIIFVAMHPFFAVLPLFYWSSTDEVL